MSLTSSNLELGPLRVPGSDKLLPRAQSWTCPSLLTFETDWRPRNDAVSWDIKCTVSRGKRGHLPRATGEALGRLLHSYRAKTFSYGSTCESKRQGSQAAVVVGILILGGT